MSLIMTGRLYSSWVRSSMLHGSETWPVRKENVVALQRAEMRMVRWMCGITNLGFVLLPNHNVINCAFHRKGNMCFRSAMSPGDVTDVSMSKGS